MAWSWNESGRIDDFSFELISNKDLDKSLGNLPCDVVGGTINFGYYTDLMASGSLDVINAPRRLLTDENLIRVWYTPTLHGSSKKIEIGTFYYTAQLQETLGIYHGTLELRSCLSRHIDDYSPKKITFNKGKTIKDMFAATAKTFGSKNFVRISGVKNNKFSKAKVFEAGTNVMEIFQEIADCADGELVVDTHGRMILRPYVRLKNRAKNITHTIQANPDSVVKPGVDVSNTLKEIPNRVVLTYEENNSKKDKVHYVGMAKLAASEARSKEKIGKWVTLTESVNQCPGKTAAAKKKYLKNKALKKLEKLNVSHSWYEFDCYYQPIEVGEVIRFKYNDINVKGLVTNIDFNLAIGGTMHVKIRKVGA